MSRLQKILLITVLIISGVAMRLLVPETWFNFSPMGAIVLFAAAYFSRNALALMVPVVIWFAGDMIINNTAAATYFEQGFTLAAPYQLFNALFIVAAFALGRLFLHKKVKVLSFLGTSISAALLFFLITNFGSWLALPYYTKDLSGLLTAYEAGIPFFRNTLTSQLFFGAVLFGAFEGVKYIIGQQKQVELS